MREGRVCERERDGEREIGRVYVYESDGRTHLQGTREPPVLRRRLQPPLDILQAMWLEKVSLTGVGQGVEAK